MAAFASHVLAEARAKVKTADNTWVAAHAARNFSGTLIVRVYRYTSPGNFTTGWAELTDDGAV